MKAILFYGSTLAYMLLCLAAGATPDKMADLGLTPDGKPLPREKTGVTTPSLVVIQSGSDGDVMLSLPIPTDYNAKDPGQKAAVLMEALMSANGQWLAGSVAFDKAQTGEGKAALEVLFTIAPSVDTNQWVYGNGARFQTIVNDVLLHNLWDDISSLQLKFRHGGDGAYCLLDEFVLAADAAATTASVADMTPDGADLPTDVLEAQKQQDMSKRSPLNSLNTGARPAGSLSGKAVYFNQGHGYTWRGNTNTWTIQRGNALENVEDFSNADLINQYVLPYIWNTGADVFTVRESDYNPNMVIVDNDDAIRSDGYGFSKTGTWTASSVSAYKNGSAPYASGTNPFTLGTGLLTSCASSASATATWAAQIPATGWYNVYVSHIAWTNRNPEAQYKVYHAGGVTDCTIDQRRWRNTWIPLGRFYFEQGAAPDKAKVVLTNVAGSTSYYVSADAVRWGGGMGLIKRGTVGISGYSNYLEEARYHLQFTGMPDDSTDSAGVRIGYNTGTLAETDRQCDENDGWYGRPRFARWMKDQATIYGAPAQDSTNLASHTNAFNGSARGFVTIRNDSSGYSDEASNTSYQNALHSVILADLQGIFNVSPGPIPQHSKMTGSYLEANPYYANMPNLLGEWLFHDNESDMALYHHPRFKQAMGRGIVRGIIDFWAAKGKTTKVYPPEPITNLCVLQESPTTVRLTWGTPATAINGRTVASAATGYHIWKSEHGRAFPNAFATITAPTSGAPTYLVTGLTPGKTYFFRVTATNAGGESQPGDTLAVRTENDAAAKKVLIVQGFNKLDPSTRVKTTYGGATTYRQIPERMNSYDYIFEHMKGIDAYCASTNRKIKVDSCNKDSITGTWVLLGGYDAVIWMSGIEAEVCTFDCWDDTSLPANARTAIKNYLNTTGKAFFLSGSEVSWELEGKGIDANFMNATLKTDYVADSSGVYSVKPVAGSIFEGLDSAIAFDDGSDWVRPGYQVQWADVIKPINGSVAALEYGAGTGTQLDSLDAQGNWKAPGYSGQSNAEAATISFDTVTKHEGSAAMKLDITWGSGNTIREYCGSADYNAFASGNTISYWVYGDNSDSTFALMLQDNDGDLLLYTPMKLNFTGWKQVSWKYGDAFTKFAGSGDGSLTSPVRINSFLIKKGTAASNTVRFDDIRLTGGSATTGAVAAVQWGTPTTSRLIYMSFPFETILDESKRNSVMARVMNFLLPATQTGALSVTITPAQAVIDGAQWSIDNGVTWNNSGVTVSDLAVGNYAITYKSLTDKRWSAPSSQSVTITTGNTTTATGTYTRFASVDTYSQY